MIEIMFRGKDICTGEWAFGNYAKHQASVEGEFLHFIVEQGMKGKTHIVDASSVGQYIGLCDANGKRAYDGDITEDDKGRRWIIFRAPGGFCTSRTSEYHKEAVLRIYEELGGLQNNGWFRQNNTIIGNVFDNKELLEDYHGR